MKKHYLIDFENVSDEGLKGYFELAEDDIVDLFYTENAARIGIDFTEACLKAEKRAVLNFKKVPAGRQALDLQLATYLGHLLALDTEGEYEYFIVSKDKGFGFVQKFWREQRPETVIRLCRTVAPDFQRADSAPALNKDENGRIFAHAETASADTGAASPADVPADEAYGVDSSSSLPSETVSADTVPSQSEALTPVTAEPAEPEQLADNATSSHSESESVLTGTAAESFIASAASAAFEAPTASADKAADETVSGINPSAVSVSDAPEKQPAVSADSEKTEKTASGKRGRDRNRTASAPKLPPKAPAPATSVKESKHQSEKPQSDDFLQSVKTRLAPSLAKGGYNGDTSAFLADLILASKGKNAPLKEVYQGTVKKYGQKKGLTIYNLIKSELKQIVKVL